MLHLHYLFSVTLNRYCNMFPISPYTVCPDNVLKQSERSNSVSGGSTSAAQFAYSFPILCSHLSLPQQDDPFLSSVFTFHSSSSQSHFIPQSLCLSPLLPILLLNGTHWPWLICCIWLNERSFTYLITVATGINDRWPLGRNTEVLKKPQLNLLRLY